MFRQMLQRKLKDQQKKQNEKQAELIQKLSDSNVSVNSIIFEDEDDEDQTSDDDDLVSVF